MKPMSKKKQIKDLNSRLFGELARTISWRNAAVAYKKDLDMWRSLYELSQLTPEVKADTEAAFKRGMEFSKRQVLNGVMGMVNALPTEPLQRHK